MKNANWIVFYGKIIICFLVYYILDLHIHYSFLLRKEIMVLIIMGVVIVSIFFIYKKYNAYLCGFIFSSVFSTFVLVEIIQVSILTKENVGESGFGIIEIISMIPLLVLGLIFSAFDFCKYKKQRE